MLPRLLRRSAGFACGLVLVAPVSLVAAQEKAGETESAPSVRYEELVEHDHVDSDGVLIRRTRNTVVLLTAAGVAQFSQVGVAFFEANQEAKLELLELTKPDGRKLDLLSSAPTDVAPVFPANLPIYSDLRVLRAAVPSLEVGDTIRFTTSVRVEPLAENQVWAEKQFAEPVDVALQRYELDLPEGSKITVHARADLGAAFEEEHKGSRWIRRWTIERKGESAAAELAAETSAKGAKVSKPKRELEPDIQITSFASWDEFGRWWASLAPPKVDSFIQAKAKELTSGQATPSDQLRALHRYVAQEIRYLALPLGLGRYRAREPEEILRTGLGDCKDKTRLLASLAESVGIEVDQVLIFASAKRKLVEEAPSPLQFDHVIVRARIGPNPIQDEIWMDPTSEMTPMGSLPEGARARRGVVLIRARKGNGGKSVRASGAPVVTEIVTTPARLPKTPTVRTETVGSIDASGRIKAKVRKTIDGDDEAYRLAFKYGDEQVRRKLFEYLRYDWDDEAKFGATAHGEPNDLEQPFWMEYEVEWPMSASIWRKAWNLWIPVPRTSIDAPPDAGGEERAAKDGEALDELELGETAHQIVTARIEVPDGVKVTPPVPVLAAREFAEFRSSYAVEGTVLKLERELTLKVESVPRAQFEELRAFRELIKGDRSQEFDFAAAPELAAGAAPTAQELLDECEEAYDAGRYAAAEPLCRRATELEPGHRWAWNDLGRTLRMLDRLDEAETVLRKQIELNPGSQVAYTNLALVFWMRHDYPAAEKLLRQQIDIAPLDSYAHGSLGRLLRIVERYDEAVDELQRALKLEPGDEGALIDLIQVEATRGRGGAARDLIVAHPELPRDLADQSSVAGKLLTGGSGPWAPLRPWFERLESSASKELEGFDAAQPSRDAVAAVFGLQMAWEGLGWVALEERRLKEALSYLDSALRLGGAPTAAAGRARALRALGEVDAANLQLAVAADLARPQAEIYERSLAAEIPSLDQRRKLIATAAEEAWKLKSFSRQVPAAAGAEGELWLVFGADGRVRTATATKTGALQALAMNLKSDPLTLPLPAGNRARVPLKLLAYCSAEGDCSLALEAPNRTWWQLSGKMDSDPN